MRSLLIVVLLVLACYYSKISGSTIDFQSSASSIKPLVSRNLTIRCALKDTPPSTGTPQAVVGKRSLTSLDRLTSADDAVGHQTKTDVALNDTEELPSNRAVTSTTENVQYINSLVISRDGTDLATVSEHFPARAVGGARGFQVTGQLTPGAGEKGFIQLLWAHPTTQDAGNFKCDVSTLDQVGGGVEFSQTLAVAESEVTMADLVAHLTSQETVIESMKQENANLNQTIGDLESNIQSLKQENANLKQTDADLKGAIQSMNQENINLKQTVDDLDKKILKIQSEKVPDIFFSVAYTSGPDTVNGPLIYNYVSANEGSAYSSSTGTFTCPIAGYYHFEVNAATSEDNYIYLALRKNGRSVMTMYTDGNDNNGHYVMSTNSIIIKLNKGDKLQVYVTHHSSQSMAKISSSDKANSWTGRLVGFA